ncbi:MAG: EF-hand domain-containing protein [Methylotenera sp.]|nr:EF-hand domain-containing protein [Methylotenera sp.]MDD4926730.1 EF-hand domain-containing protein [Methylotenera sp.]NOU39897.1 EF-hand domain-containing protein [Methylotenera sp.]
MKFNSNVITHPITSGIAAALILSSLSITAFADNKAALKNAVGSDTKIVAENKIPDIKVAESSTKPIEDVFKILDVSHDGKISPKEAVKDKVLSSNYDVVDANHDGAVSIDEYIAFNVQLPPTSTN